MLFNESWHWQALVKPRSVKILTVVEKESSINVMCDHKVKTSILQLIESSQAFLLLLFKHLCSCVFIVLVSQSLLHHNTLISRYSWYSYTTHSFHGIAGIVTTHSFHGIADIVTQHTHFTV